MVRYEYKVLDGNSQDDIERKLNELAKQGYRVSLLLITTRPAGLIWEMWVKHIRFWATYWSAVRL